MRTNIAVQKAFSNFWSSVRVVKFAPKIHPATKAKIQHLWLSAS